MEQNRNPWWVPDARGWIGMSVFGLTVMVLWMVAVFPELREDEFFKVLATAIVLTGFVQGVVGWAYAATKQGGELAERNATLIEKSQKQREKVEDAATPTTTETVVDEELPDYAR